MSVSALGEARNEQQRDMNEPLRTRLLMAHVHTVLPSLCRHDVVEVAGLTSFSFGEDDDCRYVMIFKKVTSLAHSLLSLSLHLSK